jgi:transmembrane sensor
MKADNASPQTSPSPAIRAEAAAWVARLHSSGRSRTLEAALRRWLQADTAHAQAFELATEAWEIGGSVPRGALPRMERLEQTARRRVPARLAWAAAAAVAAIALGATFYLAPWNTAVTTAVGEQRMLTLDDGSRIFLNTDTRLFVVYDDTRRHVRLVNGEALFDVARDPRRPFGVAVAGKEVVALGTAFLVRHDARGLAVTLVEGKVQVASSAAGSAGSAGPSPRLLAPGQRLTFRNDAPADTPPVLDEPPLERMTAWRRGEVVLDKTRLADAVAEMNRYSDRQLIIENPVTADIPVSGIFRAGDSARFARAVAETYGLQVRDAPRRIILTGVP